VVSEEQRPCGRDLSGQVAIVTGAAGDLGRRIGRRLSQLGASVALMDVVDPTSTSEVTGGEGLALRVDVCDEQQVSAAFAEVLSWRGRIDILVNNAGLFHGVPRVPFWEIDVATWDRMLLTNADYHAASLTPVSGELVAELSVAPPGDGDGGEVGLAEHG
jgi:3-oxoacyl-[acyl-carrier protein] reductase